MIDAADVNDLQLEDVEDYAAEYPAKDFPGDNNLHNQDGYEKKVHYRRARFVALVRANKWFLGLLVIVIAVLIVVINLLGGDDAPKSVARPLNQPPIIVDPTTIDKVVLNDLLANLLDVYGNAGLDAANLQDDSLGTTPQKQAYWWLASQDSWKTDSAHEFVQRYALTTFYYATNSKANDQVDAPGPWTDAYLWLSENHSCQWLGIVCNADKTIQAIKMSDNNVSGSLPMELSLIASTITELEFSSNLIHMEHIMYSVFESFGNLEVLLMDDNYLRTYHSGLPWQFKELTSLKKVHLSYNLLEGQLESIDKVLEHWGQLTHLEIESNFLTGSMPTEIESLTSLVYLYMRRNDMDFNLDFLKSGNFNHLFSIWLDNNRITGTIPSEIGEISTLASLSVTNATLSGSIPTEMGNLSELRRLWLYKNKLTGSIPTEIAALTELEVFEVYENLIVGDLPQGICTNVLGSGYEHKAVETDCNSKITCPNNCCTECY